MKLLNSLIKEWKTNKEKKKELDSVYRKHLAIQKKINLSPKIPPTDDYVILKNINKIYDNKVQVVFDFNLNINEKEFIVLVGPSGCGKSTTLRMIAGLENITSGELYIDKVFANDLLPRDRDLAMVFQSYALYPNLTVAENIAFSLNIRKKLVANKEKEIDTKMIKRLKKELEIAKKMLIKLQKTNETTQINNCQKNIDILIQKIKYYSVTPVTTYKKVKYTRSEIKERVLEVAKILQLEAYLNRKSKALSGGQKQRVALGRAIARKAKLFLMDEPLSNLDAKLRVSMRSEIIALHNAIGATTIYVTHDQIEAMTMASRIVVMNKGIIQQVGTPKEIYYHPANVFVAGFIGSPAMNFINAEYLNGVLFNSRIKLALSAEIVSKINAFYDNNISDRSLLKKVIFGIRPEDIAVKPTANSLQFTINVLVSELLGKECYIHCEIEGAKIVAKINTEDTISIGDILNVYFNLDKIHIFDERTKLAII